MFAFLSAIFLSAFLLFQIQPIIARFILPWYGGSPTIWTSCMMFFQVALLLGYLYAHILAKAVPQKRQPILHLSLLGLSLLLLPIGAPDSWAPAAGGQPAVEILALLTVSVGVPFVLISASGPLLQHWFAGVYPGKSPFRLYSLSNIGSLAALLTYPVLVEPRFTIDGQAVTWSWLYLVLALLFAGCGFLYARSSHRASAAHPDAPPIQAVSMLDRVLWISLAACGSTMLLAITNQISTNVAVVPFMWVLPLSIYLVTFIICFDKDAWYRRTLWVPVLLVACAMLIHLMYLEFTSRNAGFGYQLLVYSFTLFACCMVCHGELARRRSAVPHLTTFYLYVALGGAVGGVFVNLFAPVLFTGYWELHLGVFTTVLLAGICLGIDRNVLKSHLQRGLLASAWSAGLVVLGVLLVNQIKSGREATIYVDRSFFGTLYVDEWEASVDESSGYVELGERILYHGSIQHGRQMQHFVARNIPTSYYARNTGVDFAMTLHPARQSDDSALKVGAIGLGVGTISAYGRDGDSITYYEIDPYIEQVARDYFYFLEDSAAEIDIVIGDARVSMQREFDNEGSRQYDVLVLDAFSGDAIPVHLLTEEAFDLYAQHLKADGIMAVHITNTYVDLKNLVRTAAERLGKEAIWFEGSSDEWYESSNDWVIVTSNTAFTNREEVLAELADWKTEDFERVRWTDNFSNLFELIEWTD